MRRFVLVAHRWLGLGSSVLLAVIGLTGTALLFRTSRPLHSILERLHVDLMIPSVGAAIVIAATVAAVLLELSGLYLWWRRRTWAVRWRAGWRPAAYDLHNLIGAAMLAVMLLLAVTGVASIAVRQVFPPRSVVVNGTNALHTGRPFPMPVKVLYGAGGVGFLVQGLTGVIMWWPVRVRPSAAVRQPADR